MSSKYNHTLLEFGLFVSFLCFCFVNLFLFIVFLGGTLYLHYMSVARVEMKSHFDHGPSSKQNKTTKQTKKSMKMNVVFLLKIQVPC